MINVNLSGREQCANLNGSNWTMLCDLGDDHINFRLLANHSDHSNSNLSIPKTDDLLALRKAVFTNQANPALLADALEESIGHWFHCANPQGIVDTLRLCWEKEIRLSKEVVEPEVEYVEEEVS